MLRKPTYDELERRVVELERTIGQLQQVEKSRRQKNSFPESDRLFKRITANIPGVVYQFRAARDHVYTIDFLSENTKNIFGLEPDSETLFRNFVEHIPDDEKEEFLNSVREAVDRIKPWNYEGRYTKPDGTRIWFSGSSIPQAEGESVIFFGLLTDITLRKELEASLRLTQFCFDSAEIGIYQIRSDGRIHNVNGHAAEMLGYTIEQLSRLFIWDVDPSLNQDSFRQHWRTLVETGTDGLETFYTRKDGSRIPVGISSSLLEYDGLPFAICFVQDITRRKQAESEREALFKELQKALENVKMLSGLLPICSSCKKIRDDKGYWNQLETYIHAHSEVEFSHGICPECCKKLYPDYSTPKA